MRHKIEHNSNLQKKKKNTTLKPQHLKEHPQHSTA